MVIDIPFGIKQITFIGEVGSLLCQKTYLNNDPVIVTGYHSNSGTNTIAMYQLNAVYLIYPGEKRFY